MEAAIGLLAGTPECPWRRSSRSDFNKETLFGSGRRNYKVHVYLGQDHSSMRSHAAILNTGPGPCFIKNAAIPYKYLKKIFPVNADVEVRDASNSPLSMVGKTNFYEQIGTKENLATIYVADKGATPIIL